MMVRQIISLSTYEAPTDAGTKRVHRGILELYFEAQVTANCIWLKLNPDAPNLYASGVEYDREGMPEVWLDIPAILAQGYDDCEGLACWLAAEARTRAPNSIGPSKRPLAVVKLKQTKRSGLWHALVCDKATGQIFDPSKKLGMGRP